MALRLKQAGVNAFSVVTFPLAGRSFWRGRPYAFDWTAIDGHLSSGETLDAIWTAAPSAEFLYIDPTRERVSLPSQDLIKMTVDAFLLLRSGTPLRNRCGA